MPIPTPHKNEEEKDFISRCMEDDIMNKDYPDNPQRAAVCYSQWKKKKEDVEITINSNTVSPKRDEKGRIIVAENVPVIITGTIKK